MKRRRSGSKSSSAVAVCDPTPQSLHPSLSTSPHQVRCTPPYRPCNYLRAHLVPPVTPIPTMGAAIARLTQSMSELTTSHAQHSAAMSKLGEEQRLLEAREKEMREMIAKAEEKRSWFTAFREWVESVATFLDEKVSWMDHRDTLTIVRLLTVASVRACASSRRSRSLRKSISPS